MRQTVRKLFPSLVETLQRLSPEVVDQVCDLSQENTVRSLYVGMIALQQSLNGDISRLSTVGIEHITELVRAKELAETIDDIDALNFLQFGAATGILGQCIVTSQYARAGDWFIAALNDELAFGEAIAYQPADIGRIAKVLHSNHPFISLNAAMLISQWANVAYLYMRRMRAFPAVGALAFSMSYEAVRLELRRGDDEAIMALLRMAEWAAVVQHPAMVEIAAILRDLYEELPPETAAVVAGTLSTSIGDQTELGSIGWARIVYSKHWDIADQSVRLAAIARLIAADGYSKVYENQLFELIADIRTQVQQVEVFYKEQFLEATFQALYPALGFLLKRGQASDALAIIAAWYEGGGNVIENAIVVIPLLEDGALWSKQGSARIFPYASSDARRTYFSAMNHALRIVISHEGFTGLEEEGAHDPQRVGLPDLSWGDQFERATVDLLCLTQVAANCSLPTDLPCVPLASMPIPFQAVTLRHLGVTWPMPIRIEKPLPDRPVRKVGIWMLPILHGDLELHRVTALFEAKGVPSRVEYSGGDSERQRFLDLYADDSIDVLWVIGHGERVAFAPDESNLHVFEGAPISITDLPQVQIGHRQDRRLLVLNVCSAGGTVSYGGIPRVGLASMLTSKIQCSISHLWPTTPIAAVSFGILLATELSEGSTFFDSYCKATVAANQANGTLGDTLFSLTQDDVLRSLVANSHDDMRNLLLSGSTIFLE